MLAPPFPSGNGGSHARYNASDRGNDPWCVDETWLGFIDALVNGREPSYTTFGTAYMLMGDTPVSNTDPRGVKEAGREKLA